MTTEEYAVLHVARELHRAIRRFNARARRARRAGMPFTVRTRRRGQMGCDAIHLDLLASMPVLTDLPSGLLHERCEAWINLIWAAAEVNYLIDKARLQNAKVVLRLAGPEQVANDQQLQLASLI